MEESVGQKIKIDMANLNKTEKEWVERQLETMFTMVSLEEYQNINLLSPVKINVNDGFVIIETRETPFCEEKVVFNKQPSQFLYILSDELKEKLHQWSKSESSDSEKIKDSNKQEEVDLDYGKFLRKSVEKYFNKSEKKIVVRWLDGYKETFFYEEFRAGCDYLWIKLTDGTDRWIPNKNIRTFSVFPIDTIKQLIY